MFVNRSKELALLNEEYTRENLAFSVIYGRRRVGKTTLIKEYMAEKQAIYFLVTLESEKVVLARFVNIVADFFDDDFLRGLELNSFEQLFIYIAKKQLDKKLLIVIDEFQYLGKINSAMPSLFQYIVDEIIKNSNIHLILCGSIISMMCEQTLSYNSPLYGRRTSAIKLEALKFAYLKPFFPHKTDRELIELYAVLDGVPKYIEMFRETQNIFSAIEKNILDKNAYLYDEPRYILQNEVNEPLNYFTILEAIARGEHKLGHIASRLGKNVQNITSYMTKLMELDIIYKEVPITEVNPLKSKKGLYYIKDNFFRFWFLYVLNYKSQLEMENRNFVLKKIKENFEGFVSKTYEDLSVAKVLEDFELLKAGRWWNKNEEIDIVGVAEEFLIVGECKYSNKKVGTDILAALKKKSEEIELKLPIEKYLLFSKSGFTPALLAEAETDERLVLYTLLQREVSD